jgi:hypothetical protein
MACQWPIPKEADLPNQAPIFILGTTGSKHPSGYLPPKLFLGAARSNTGAIGSDIEHVPGRVGGKNEMK